MYIKYRKLLSKMLSFILFIVFLSSSTLNVYAQAGEEEKLRSEIEEITWMLENVFEKQYEQKRQQVSEEIMKEGYDVTMTMQSFYDNGNPFKDIDYTEVISRYSVIKQYCKDHSMITGAGISDIEFLKMDIERREIEEIVPILYPAYEEREDGYFYHVGNYVIEEETEVEIYTPIEDGADKYICVGKEIVQPETVTTVYGEVSLTLIDLSEMEQTFGIREELEEVYDVTKHKIEQSVNPEILSQSVFIKTRNNFESVSELTENQLVDLISKAEDTERNVLETAVTLLGQVPYQWGGKAAGPGYDTSWWLYNDKGEQKGLDCSGFVQWVYMTSGYEKELTDKLLSTNSILNELPTITQDELRPGDIGILNQGEETNHTGIYLGNGYFIHCSSGKGTVVIDKFPFKIFKSLRYKKEPLAIDEELQKEYIKKQSTTIGVIPQIEESDVILLAQLIENEAGNQGYNGWVAVGECVVNRMNSSDFPNTVYEVIYDENQFSNKSRMEEITPREEVISVARDVLNRKTVIFNNPQVLYFRNPMITSGIPADDKQDWKSLKWYTAINDHAFYIP